MTVKAQRVLQEALQLPVKARVDLAGRLLHSLDDPPDEGVEEAWAAEIARRMREVETGKVKLVPWSRVRRELRQKVRAAKRH